MNKSEIGNWKARSVMILIAAAMAGLVGDACGGGGGGGGGGAPGVPPTLSGPASPLANGAVGTASRTQFGATGSVPISWRVTAGAPPPGLSVDPSSGSYSGTPTLAGTYVFTVTASNPWGSASASYTHTIPAGSAAPRLVGASPTDATLAVGLNQAVVLVFSEPMNQASVQAAISFSPVVAGLTFAWSGTRVTVQHANFAASTLYQATVAATALDLGGAALVAGPLPNPFQFTTGTLAVTVAANLFEEAYALYTAEDYSGALAALQAVMAAYPADPILGHVHFYMGRCYHQMSDYPQARTHYQDVLTGYPASSKADDAQFRLGETDYDEAAYAAARAAFQQVLAAYPGSDSADDAQLYIGRTYHEQLNYAQARVEYQAVIAVYPASDNADDARYYIGRTYHDESNYVQARVEYQAAITTYPAGDKADEAQYYIGESYYDAGNYVTAQPQFQLVITNYPASDSADNAQYRKGRCQHQLGFYATARTEYQAVIANYPVSAKVDDARFRIGMTYHDEANYPAEVTALQSLITNEPFSPLVATAQVHLNDISGPRNFHP